VFAGPIFPKAAVLVQCLDCKRVLLPLSHVQVWKMAFSGLLMLNLRKNNALGSSEQVTGGMEAGFTLGAVEIIVEGTGDGIKIRIDVDEDLDGDMDGCKDTDGDAEIFVGDWLLSPTDGGEDVLGIALVEVCRIEGEDEILILGENKGYSDGAALCMMDGGNVATVGTVDAYGLGRTEGECEGLESDSAAKGARVGDKFSFGAKEGPLEGKGTREGGRDGTDDGWYEDSIDGKAEEMASDGSDE